jgi:DNA-binding NarL/FixJ family response regulator
MDSRIERITEVVLREFGPEVSQDELQKRQVISDRRASLPPGPGRPRVHVDAARVVELRSEGKSWREIALELDRGEGTV